MEFNTQDIITDLNAITYVENDLLLLIHEFCDIYFQNNDDKLIIDPLFGNEIFIQQSILIARESVILGVNSLILDEKVDFKAIIEGCTNLYLQDNSLRLLSLKDNQPIINFWNSLRTEIFTRIVSQNKDFSQVSELSKNIINERKDNFSNFCK